MNIFKALVLLSLLSYGSFYAVASDDEYKAHGEEEHEDHDEHPKEEKKKHAHAKGEKHSDEEGDDHEDEHGDEDGEEHAEASPAVGPNRGITSITSDGFTLAPEAAASFTIKTTDFTGGLLALPRKSIVHVKDEVSVFRLRDNLYKRVPVKVVKKGEKDSVVESSELKASDKVVTEGAAFLRIAEVAAKGGVSHGHSH